MELTTGTVLHTAGVLYPTSKKYRVNPCLSFVLSLHMLFYPIPNNKSLDRSKLNALADRQINVTQKLKFVSSRVENIVGT